MLEIYQASDLIDAHVVKGLLEQHGITTHVLGADLASGAGELPAFGVVRLAVEELDQLAAEKLIQAYQAGELQIESGELPNGAVPE